MFCSLLKLLFLHALLQRCWSALDCQDEACGISDDTYLLQATRENLAKKSLKAADLHVQAPANSNKPSLRFLVTTVGSALTSGHKISRSWGKDMKNLVYVVGEDAKVAPQLGILHVSNVTDVHYPPMEKNLRGLAQAFRQYPTDDWYLRCDDDSYVDVKGMTAFLQTFADKSPRYLGSYAVGRAAELGLMQIPEGMSGYAEGGFCEILSNSAMHALLPHMDSCIRDAQTMLLEHRHSDVELGKCLFRAGVNLTKLPASIFTRIGPGAKGTHPMADASIESLFEHKTSLLRAIVVHPLKNEQHMSLVHQWHSEVAQKLAGIPIYWIGESSNLARFYHMSTNLAMLAADDAQVQHIEAVNSSEAFRVANFTALEMILGLKVTDPSLWKVDNGCVRTCVIKANENPAAMAAVGGCMRDCQNKVLGCSLSHLKAIHQAYAANHSYALIMEDDVDVSPASKWKAPLFDLINDSSPENPWEVMQLVVHAAPLEWLRLQEVWKDSKKPQIVPVKSSEGGSGLSSRKFHATGAYLISRPAMERFVTAFPMQNGIIQVKSACLSDKQSIAGFLDFTADDCLLSGDIFQNTQTKESALNSAPTGLSKFIFTPPLFSDTEDISEAIHGDSDFHEQSRHMWHQWFEEVQGGF